jgi:chromosome segregation protein
VAAARLTALRLVGFKSFAERTTVEFGPGISAVVGPNGSGKSNLADALRWTLGEQGRMLRTRRSEDVIFAGSSSRRAIGMADVTLVIDNGDRLLPVDYGEVEIGRRLYRSGESEYLLNRQRIRLRDLVELLDAGNLADNAFLFIGQGMVDQALALRPEERRPLFEEAAGVRRHERRRRQAEAELVEAGKNLDRLRDVLAELRPQAKRLAAQADQLQARRTAGMELAEGLLAAARARWIGASVAAAKEQADVGRARAAADAALAALKAAEDEAAALSEAIAHRAEAERGQRESLDRQRGGLTDLRIASARVESELAAASRDADRLAGERKTLESRLSESARVLAAPEPAQAAVGDDELELVERQLDDLERQAVPGDAGRDLVLRTQELDQQERRRDGLARTLAAATAKLADLEPRVADAEAEHARASSALSAATAAAGAAELHATQSRALAEQSASALASAQGRIAQTEAELGGVRARVAALDALIAGADDGLARSARARGARLLGEGLEVDRDLVAAVSAALGAATAAYVVEPDAAVALAGRRGTLVLRTPRQRSESSSVAVIEAAVAAGGGRLSDAVRRDPQGEVTRLLERVIWIPDMAGAMALRPSLPTGWRIATRAGELVTDEGIVTLASGESLLDRRSERDAARAQMEDLEARAGDARAAFETAQKDAASATEAAQSAARDYDAARRALRQAEEAERVAARRLEQLLRERTWERAQVQRLTDELAGIDALAQRLRTDVDALTAAAATRVDEAERVARANATRTELRVRRDELRRERDERAARARAVEETRRRAEIGRAMDEGRLAELERDAAAVNARIAELTGRRDELARQIAVAGQSAAVAAATLDELLRQGSDERGRLVAAERAAIDARERLRAAESAARDSELQALEARLLLEQTREQLLLELATIGADGQRSLRSAAGLDPEPATDASDRAADDTTETQTIEELLDAVVARWRSDSAVETAREAPSAGRLAALRRRFNELGAGNPFAVEEYSELSDRLEALEAQRLDMESAIASTGELIGSLSAMINEQFRSTFAALEGAFERRFHELFGGGDAQLSLTAPDDISVTGVEIHARPPGKKRQPLSMLSGGERALTAVSLLLAMLEVRPVPFCVLDEVDAALDEANVSRFSSALRGLSQNTQFIVITHNRGTIEGADALYGVTIGDDAVSRVVSLKLPEPSAKSSQDRGANGHSTEEALVEAALA